MWLRRSGVRGGLAIYIAWIWKPIANGNSSVSPLPYTRWEVKTMSKQARLVLRWLFYVWVCRNSLNIVVFCFIRCWWDPAIATNPDFFISETFSCIKEEFYSWAHCSENKIPMHLVENANDISKHFPFWIFFAFNFIRHISLPSRFCVRVCSFYEHLPSFFEWLTQLLWLV